MAVHNSWWRPFRVPGCKRAGNDAVYVRRYPVKRFHKFTHVPKRNPSTAQFKEIIRTKDSIIRSKDDEIKALTNQVKELKEELSHINKGVDCWERYFNVLLAP
jgi:hypothetical protein